MTNPWIIRSAQGEDLPFIYSTWAKCYRFDSEFGISCPFVFFSEFNKVMDAILNDSNTQVIVAAHPDDDFVFFGYLIYEPGLVHFAFTKKSFWRKGIAKSLLKYAGFNSDWQYSHSTRFVEPILRGRGLVHNPFKMFKEKESSWPEVVQQ